MMDLKAIACYSCGVSMKPYDTVLRVVRTKGRKTRRIKVKRYRCPKCGTIRRAIPSYIYPYKQYEAEVIDGVLEGLITADTYGFEDYPCEMTMKRWKSQNLQGIL